MACLVRPRTTQSSLQERILGLRSQALELGKKEHCNQGPEEAAEREGLPGLPVSWTGQGCCEPAVIIKPHQGEEAPWP